MKSIKEKAATVFPGLRTICSKYVESSSVFKMKFKDGSTIGMRTLLEVGLGVKEIKDVI